MLEGRRRRRERTWFDPFWYSLQVGRPLDARGAAEHYRSTGAEAGLSPHPLYDAGAGVDHDDWAASGGTDAAHPLAGWTPPQGDLESWIRARGDEWARRRDTVEQPSVRDDGTTGADDVALRDLLVDWDELARRRPEPGLTSVLVPTYQDWSLTTACVETLAASEGAIEVIVWDNGSDLTTSVVLDSLPLRFPGTRVHHSPVNHGFALGNDLALADARGDVVVFLNNDTTVPPRWLEPVRAALDDETVAAAQPLLLYPTGSIQSAGVAFPSTGGIPHAFLNRFPVEDAAGLEDEALHALTGAALATRYVDAVALRGFDPVFRNGMEDIDLCLRLRDVRPGRCVVLPQQPITHYESRTPGRYDKYARNRAVWLDRWGATAPRDDVDLWARRGFTVVDHQAHPVKGLARHLQIPDPVLVRTARLQVSERPSRLRWAIKSPAPAGPDGEGWSETRLSRSLAAALRVLGQEVVIDARPEHHRATGRHDDVSLSLRGVKPFDPTWDQVSIMWVVSHPERVTPAEAASHDVVLAASIPWAQERSREWGTRLEAFLPAVDPAVDPAVGPVDNPADDVVVVSGSPVLRDGGFIAQRVFDAVAGGARVAAEPVAGLDSVYDGLFGDSVRVFDDPADLARLIEHRETEFGDLVARLATADRVGREHSVLARAERLVELAREARARRGFAR